MPIRNLTDRAARFPRLGIIRKGEPRPEHGKAPGRDTNYFRLDTQDTQLAQDWLKIYGEKPQSLQIVLPYHTTDENLDSWMEEWKAASLVRRCDGESQVLRLEAGKYNSSPVPCLMDCNCKPSGKLIIVLPALKRLGYLEVQTHSKWDLIGLSENLQAIELSLGTLQGVPLILSRREREISSPKPNSSDRMRVKKWLLQIEVDASFSQKLLASWQQKSALALGEGSNIKAISAGSDWREKGIAWAIEQGLNQKDAIELAEFANSKKVFFDLIKLELEKQSIKEKLTVSNDEIVDFQALDGEEF